MTFITSEDRAAILEQCIMQRVGASWEIQGFTEAYRLIKSFSCQSSAVYIALAIALDKTSHALLEEIILSAAQHVDNRNFKGYRKVSFTFLDTTKAIDADMIPRSMESFCISFCHNGFDTPTEAYTEFEKIHPFIDGNGRVGMLLFNWYTVLQGGEWPTTMPPDVFKRE